MEEEKRSRTWLPWAVLALVVLCGAAVVCGLAGMMAFSRPGATLAPPGAQEAVTPEAATLPPSPSPISPPPISFPAPSPTPVPPSPPPSPTPTPELTPTPQPSPSPTCPPVSGPFAALWEKYQGQLGCPLNTAHSSWMAQEHFERGQMFWREDNDRIVVLYNVGSWALYRDIWNEGDPEYSCPDANTPAQSPPTPRRGFGKIWCTYPAVRQGLGWATNYERGFHGTVQDFSQGTILRTDTGETYVMVEGGGWWRE